MFEKGSMFYCFVYILDDKDLKYIDEFGCDLLGIFEVLLLNYDLVNVEVEEIFYFGEIELRVIVWDLLINKVIDFMFDIL